MYTQEACKHWLMYLETYDEISDVFDTFDTNHSGYLDGQQLASVCLFLAVCLCHIIIHTTANCMSHHILCHIIYYVTSSYILGLPLPCCVCAGCVCACRRLKIPAEPDILKGDPYLRRTYRGPIEDLTTSSELLVVN